MQLNLFSSSVEENENYLSEELITYIGNKRALLSLIEKGLNEINLNGFNHKIKFIDLFSGSGVVSRYMKKYSSLIHSNDLERYSAFVNDAYLENKGSIDFPEVDRELETLSEWIDHNLAAGFISQMYAPANDLDIQPGERVFYTKRNANYIDTACRAFEELPLQYMKYFKANLIVQASIHNNTGGVFKGFYKDSAGIGTFGGAGKNALKRILGDINIKFPVLSNFSCEKIITCRDAVSLSRENGTEYDIAYLDPPYNQHPYGSNYFMLNLIETYVKPTEYSFVSGIPTDWNRSPFNKKKFAAQSLFSCIENINSKYVFISYNSEGFISLEEFMDELSKYSDVTYIDSKYNTYKASRNLFNRDQYVTEYLFIIKK
jgi:adenine-specific DNA-methyltransferase